MITKEQAVEHGVLAGSSAIKYCEVGESDIREAGCDHGHLEVCEDCLTSAAYESELNARDFSPFEFLATELDEDDSGELWEAYEEGIETGIKEGMRDRLKSERDYS